MKRPVLGIICLLLLAVCASGQTNKKVSELSSLTVPHANDLLLIADMTVNTSKKITYSDFQASLTGGTGIVTLGTITTGVWHGTVLGSTYGGTGVNNGSSTITIGGNVTVSGAFTTTLTVTGNTSVTLPTSGTLVNSAVSSLSSLTTVGTITSGGLGTGAVIGGTTITLGSDATGDVYYRNSGGVLTRLGIGSTNQVLTVAAGLPSWATPSSGFSDPMTTRGDIIVRNSSNTTARLAVGSANTVLKSDGTDVAYGQVTNAMLAGSIDLTAKVTGVLPSANGGTGMAFFTVAGPASSAKTFTFPNANSTVLTDNAAVTVAQGGTGIASGTSGGIPYFSGSTTIASSGALTANLPVIGGGAGSAPTVGTRQGNTTAFVTYAGSAPSTNDCAKFDANGNITTNGAACGSGGTGVADPGSNGVMVRTALNTSTARTITGTAGAVSVTNGDGVSGNPTLDLPGTITGARTLSGAVTLSGGIIESSAITQTQTAVVTGSSYTVLSTDALVPFDSTSNAITVTLEDLGTGNAGRKIIFFDRGGNALVNNIVIQRAGSDLFDDGGTSITLDVNFATIELLWTGSSATCCFKRIR